MIDILKLLAVELAESFIQPRIEKAKIDFKLALITGLVVALFAFLAMICLFMVVYQHLVDVTGSPQEAALILFGFSIFMCIGAIVVHAIGKRVEQDIYESKGERKIRAFAERMPQRPDFDIADRVHDIFANNKASALIAATVTGIVLGTRPRMVFRAASKLVLGKKSRPPERDGYRRERSEYRRRR